MYVPAHFAAPEGALGELLRRAPLADLVTNGPEGLIATPLPLLFDADRGPHGTLLGHVARNNPHWRAARVAAESFEPVDGPSGSPDSLVILRGPDAYISPTWYASTTEHGRVVPTWNYLTVHAHGHLIAHDDADWTFDIVRRLTEHFEDGFTPPWTVDDPPPRFFAGQLRAIVGVEIVLTSVAAKYKLGQNRTADDVAGAVRGLDTGSPTDRAVAAAMRTANP